MVKNRLKSQKGFTLVELMVVIVIMGVLVAVAIPVYGAVTTHSEKQACHANCEIIEKAVVQYMLSEGNNNFDAIVTKDENQKELNLKNYDILPQSFKRSFSDGECPKCPIAGNVYSVYYDNNTEGHSVIVKCSEHQGKND